VSLIWRQKCPELNRESKDWTDKSESECRSNQE
jgi:hypothetical protein